MVVHPDLGGNQNLINIELDRKLDGTERRERKRLPAPPENLEKWRTKPVGLECTSVSLGKQTQFLHHGCKFFRF